MTSSPTESENGGKDQARPRSDFSIEHILNRAGNSEPKTEETAPIVPFPWLQCTRYCPPKIPRNPKKEAPQKRQLGRHPRIPFTSQQLAVLEEKFQQTPYLSSTEVTKLSRTLQLADIRVKIWFQNRRARERREKAQQESEQKVQNVVIPQTNCSSVETTNSSSRCSSVGYNISPGDKSIFPLATSQSAYEHFQQFPFLLNYTK